MRFFIFLIVSGAFFFTAYAQQALNDSAFEKFKSGDYHSAIQRYEKVLKRSNHLYELEILGTCYLRADSIQQAKKVFQAALDYYIANDFTNIKFDCCKYLAEIYVREKNYPQALCYYKKLGTLWDQAKLEDVNSFRFHFFNNLHIAKCYQQMGLADTGLKVMTPYMFCDYKMIEEASITLGTHKTKENISDSLTIDSIGSYYIELLQKQYSKRQLQKELKKAQEAFSLTITPSAPRPGWRRIEIRFFTVFLNQRIVLQEYITYTQDKSDPVSENSSYSKKFQYERFMDLTLVKMLSTLR